MTIFRKFKYVIIDDIAPRICSECEQHRDLTGQFKATSAGFGQINIDNEGKFSVQCWGESISLKLKVGPRDEMLLRHLFEEP